MKRWILTNTIAPRDVVRISDFLDERDTIQIMYHEGAHKIEAHKGGWYDLAVPMDIELKQGDFKIIPFNISMKMPLGYEGHLLPRSSTFKKYGILQANGMGVIENSYCSSEDIWGMPVYATKDVVIKDGTRIAQFRIAKEQPVVQIKEVDNLDKYAIRGGFGSSGEKAADAQ